MLKPKNLLLTVSSKKKKTRALFTLDLKQQYYSVCCQVHNNQSSPVLGLYGQLKCCRSRSDSACWGSSVWERSPAVGVEEGVGERLCLWWVKLSLQTKALRWVHCHHLQKKTDRLYEFLKSGGEKRLTRYVWSGGIKQQNVKHYFMTPTTLCRWWTRAKDCSKY